MTGCADAKAGPAIGIALGPGVRLDRLRKHAGCRGTIARLDQSTENAELEIAPLTPATIKE